MPITGIWLDSRLKEIFIESRTHESEFGQEIYGHPKLEYTKSYTCKTRENSIFLKNGKIVISIENLEICLDI